MMKRLLIKSGVLLSISLMMNNNWAMEVESYSASAQSVENADPLTLEELGALRIFIERAIPIQISEEKIAPVRENNERYSLSYTSICGAKNIVRKLENLEKISLSQDQKDIESFLICLDAASGFNFWERHHPHENDSKDANLELIKEKDRDGNYTLESKVRYNIKNKSLSGIKMEQKIVWDNQTQQYAAQWILEDTQEITLYKIMKTRDRLQWVATLRSIAINKSQNTNPTGDLNPVQLPPAPISPITFAHGGPMIYSKPPQHFRALMTPGVLTGKESQEPTQYSGKGCLTAEQLRTFEKITKSGFQFSDMEWSNRPSSKYILTIGGADAVTLFSESFGFDEKTILQLLIDWKNYWENPTLKDGFYHLWKIVATFIPIRRLSVDTIEFLKEWTEEQRSLFMDPLAAFTTT